MKFFIANKTLFSQIGFVKRNLIFFKGLWSALQRAILCHISTVIMDIKNFPTRRTLFLKHSNLLVAGIISISAILCQANNTSIAFAADLWKEGSGADVISGTDNVADIDTLLASSSTNPLDRLLSTYINGVTLTWSDANTITVGIGEIVCSDGSVQRFRKNTSTFTIDLSTFSATSGVDVNGDKDKASSWFHVYANADADATTFTGTASLSEANPTGVTYYKYIGSVYNDAGQDMLAWFWRGDGNDIVYMWDIPFEESAVVSDNAWSAALDCSSSMPFSSELGIFGLFAEDATNVAGIWIRPNGSTTALEGNEANGLYNKDAGNLSGIGGQRICATDGSQQIQYFNHSGDDDTSVTVEGFVLTR